MCCGARWSGRTCARCTCGHTKAVRQAPILGDTAAAEAVDRIEYDWARTRRAMRPGSNQYMVTMRAKQLDDWSGDFLWKSRDESYWSFAEALQLFPT